jgi:hypothetical protein
MTPRRRPRPHPRIKTHSIANHVRPKRPLLVSCLPRAMNLLFLILLPANAAVVGQPSSAPAFVSSPQSLHRQSRFAWQ